MSIERSLFAKIEPEKRIWVIAPLEGDAERLKSLHKKIARNFCVGDVVVYLGNLIGKKGNGCCAIDEALLFRRAILSIEGTTPDDIVFLRGGQEEMLHFLQLFDRAFQTSLSSRILVLLPFTITFLHNSILYNF